jgi:hypothetical protein
LTKAERYVRENLATELGEVLASPIAKVENGLTIFEKTLIYHYTKDGYASVNRELREGSKHSELSALLERSLKKLPDYVDEVHRTTFLGNTALDRYRSALNTGAPVTELAFISSSRSPKTSRIMPRYNTRFQIASNHGKSIEDISYAGSHTVENEKEVLFCPGSKFEVLQVTTMPNYVLIKMVEL